METARLTLAKPARFEGIGLHTGAPVRMTVHPGSDGIAFRLGAERVAALPENVTDTTRSTRLGPIGTVEHVMSALAGHGVTDAEVELDASEVPGMDGSSATFYAGIAEAGVEQIGTAESPQIFTRLFMQDDHGLKLAVGKGSGHWRFVYDLGERWPHRMAYECEDVVGCYAKEIAPARTLVLESEIEQARAAGLGRGLDESSVLVIGPMGFRNQARFPDEPARHKLLDLIGDLALAGVPIGALNVVAERSGHRSNVAMAHRLRQALLAARSAAGSAD